MKTKIIEMGIDLQKYQSKIKLGEERRRKETKNIKRKQFYIERNIRIKQK
jgi:hypothetical protein